MVEPQLGAGSDRLEIEADRGPHPSRARARRRPRSSGPATAARPRSTRITTSLVPHQEAQGVTECGRRRRRAPTRPVRASISVSAEYTASGAAEVKVFVERKSPSVLTVGAGVVVLEVAFTAGPFLVGFEYKLLLVQGIACTVSGSLADVKRGSFEVRASRPATSWSSAITSCDVGQTVRSPALRCAAWLAFRLWAAVLALILASCGSKSRPSDEPSSIAAGATTSSTVPTSGCCLLPPRRAPSVREWRESSPDLLPATMPVSEVQDHGRGARRQHVPAWGPRRRGLIFSRRLPFQPGQWAGGARRDPGGSDTRRGRGQLGQPGSDIRRGRCLSRRSGAVLRSGHRHDDDGSGRPRGWRCRSRRSPTWRPPCRAPASS